jgi:hypothetical protein
MKWSIKYKKKPASGVVELELRAEEPNKISSRSRNYELRLRLQLLSIYYRVR